MNQVIQTISEAYASSKKLRILGYTSSSGEVKDLDVEILPDGGYNELVKQSLAFLNDDPERPHIIDGITWKQACEEQKQSWQRTLAGTSIVHAPKEALIDSGAGYLTKVSSADTLILRHLRRLNVEIVAPTYKGTVASAKQALVAMCPLGRYIGQINLSPGKFKSISALNE